MVVNVEPVMVIFVPIGPENGEMPEISGEIFFGAAVGFTAGFTAGFGAGFDAGFGVAVGWSRGLSAAGQAANSHAGGTLPTVEPSGHTFASRVQAISVAVGDGEGHAGTTGGPGRLEVLYPAAMPTASATAMPTKNRLLIKPLWFIFALNYEITKIYPSSSGREDKFWLIYAVMFSTGPALL
jgi:hypothetical protein